MTNSNDSGQLFTTRILVLICASPVIAGEIRIQNIWAELEPDAVDGDIDLDVYMRIVNTGAKADRLYAVRTRDAEEAHLHAVSNEEEVVMKASSAGELSDGLRATTFVIGAGQTFALETLLDDSIKLVTLTGPAGTGKTRR